jgi:CspA family cold shock protein
MRPFMENKTDEMHHGVIRSYYPIKGFGFIRRGKGKDVFFFRTQASGEEILYPGTQVKFLIKNGEKGPFALKIERIG